MPWNWIFLMLIMVTIISFTIHTEMCSHCIADFRWSKGVGYAQNWDWATKARCIRAAVFIWESWKVWEVGWGSWQSISTKGLSWQSCEAVSYKPSRHLHLFLLTADFSSLVPSSMHIWLRQKGQAINKVADLLIWFAVEFLNQSNDFITTHLND